MTVSTADQTSNSFRKALSLRFAGYYSIAVTIVIATFVSLEYHYFSTDRENQQKQESLRLQLASKIIAHELKHVVVDLLNITEMRSVHSYVESGSPQSRIELERALINLVANVGVYDKIRFIDRSGQVKIRVNYKNGITYSSPVDQLQDISSSYYFREATEFGRGEIFISPLDLNVEHGEIERPYKPTLRAATPVFDSKGNLKGIIVLNYVARLIREHFEGVMRNSWGRPMLVNAGGYWLYSPESADEWGFILGHDAAFATRFSAEWDVIQSQKTGVVQTRHGVFVFNTLDLAREIKTSGTEYVDIVRTERSINQWKLISHVPVRQVVFGLLDSLRSRPALVVALILFSAITSLLLAILRTRNSMYTRQLRETGLRTRLLLDSVGEGIFGVDLDGNCTFINPRAVHLLGYQDTSDLVGKPIHQMIHHTGPDGSNCTADDCKVNLALREQACFHVDNEYMWRKDGTPFPVEYWSTPIIDNGRPLGAVAAFNDISHRKMAEDTLRRSHEELETRVRERTADLESINAQLKIEISEREITQHELEQERNFVSAVLTTVGALIIVLDTRARIVQFNKACEQATGYQFEELQGEYVWDYLIPAEQVEGVKGVFDRLTAGDFPSSYKNDWVTKTGQRRLIAWSNTALTNPVSGKVEYVVATGIDITEQAKAERALRDSENQLRLITDNLPVLIAYLDSERRYRFNNRAFEEWFGISRERLFGKHIKEVIGKTAYLGIREKIDKVLSGVEVHFEAIVPYKTAGERYVDAIYIPDVNADGKVAGCYALIQDVTVRKRAEERARQHQEEVAHVGRINMMGELATELAHELNQPLTAIQSYAGTAFHMLTSQSRTLSAEDLRMAVDGIRGQAERAGKIIRHLRDFVRKRAVEKIAIDLTQVVQNAIELIGPELKRHNVALEIADDLRLPLVKADSIQIEQVLFNVVRNSIQAMASSNMNRPKLTINSSHAGNKVLIEVADTGPGMNADTLNNIFKPYVSTKGSVGMGMGLSICRSIMEAHKGEIWAESEPGRGATFYISLPIDDEQRKSDNKSQHSIVSEADS